MKKDSNIDSAFGTLVKNSEILFSTRSISSLLVSWLMGDVLRFSIITTESTGISVRWPSWTHLMQVSSREREGRITFFNIWLRICLQKACLLDGHMETHTDNPPALWQNMIDKYQESAEEEARIIKQKENVRKLFIPQRWRAPPSHRQVDQ